MYAQDIALWTVGVIGLRRSPGFHRYTAWLCKWLCSGFVATLFTVGCSSGPLRICDGLPDIWTLLSFSSCLSHQSKMNFYLHWIKETDTKKCESMKLYSNQVRHTFPLRMSCNLAAILSSQKEVKALLKYISQTQCLHTPKCEIHIS